MNNQKLKNILRNPQTNWKYILIVAILAFLVGGGIFWWLPKQEIEMPEIEMPERKVPEGVEVPADWKTYRNEEYGFEISFPGEASVRSGEDYKGHPWVDIYPQPEEGKMGELFPGISGIKVEVQSKGEGVTHQGRCVSPLDVRKEGGSRAVEVDGVYMVEVSGARFLKEEGFASTMVGTEGYTRSVSFTTEKNGNCITINFVRSLARYKPEPPFDEQQREEITFQILSTFRFLE